MSLQKPVKMCNNCFTKSFILCELPYTSWLHFVITSSTYTVLQYYYFVLFQNHKVCKLIKSPFSLSIMCLRYIHYFSYIGDMLFASFKVNGHYLWGVSHLTNILWFAYSLMQGHRRFSQFGVIVNRVIASLVFCVTVKLFFLGKHSEEKGLGQKQSASLPK